MKLTTPKDPAWSVLFQRAEPVTDVVAQVYPHLATMKRIMHEAKGIGLAAPQIGVPFRFFITGMKERSLELVINPEVTERATTFTSRSEGCLSWPRRTTYVRRPDWIKATWTSLQGQHSGLLDAVTAQVFLHETDHLDGVTIFSR